MPRALISVSQDGYTYLSLDGATSRYSDTGQAMTYLGDYARATETPVSVTIDNGDQGIDVEIDAAGRIVPAQSTAPKEPASADAAAAGTSAPAPTSPPDETAPVARSTPASQPDAPAPAAPATNPTTTSASGTSRSSETQADASPTAAMGTDPAPTAGTDTGRAPEPAEAGAGEEYPLGTPYSGPAAQTPPKPKQKPTQKPTGKRPAKKKQRRLGRLTVPGLVLIGIAILMIGAFVIPNIVPTSAPESPQTINSDQQLNASSDLTVETTDDIVPTFENTPTWEAKIPGSASVTASDRGVLVVDNDKLEVLDPATGEVRYSGTVDQAPTFAVDTRIGGRAALLWQVGDSAQALFDGESTPRSYSLPPNTRISSAGTSVLVKSGNRLSTFGEDGLIDVPTPESGSTPMAVENGELYSADFDGPVVATNIESGDKRDIDLEAPADGLRIIKWISAGHGKVIALWGEQGASTNSGHRIQLVVHSLDDGSILSTVTTTTDIVGEMSWVRGQGGQRAYIGPYLFDLETGLLLADTTRADVNLSEPRGTIVPCTIDNEAACLLAGQTAYRSDTRLLAVTDNGNQAIVDGVDSTIRAYPKRPQTANG
ncbi:hypothetical protein [Brevibacterium casei]|uniref:hypothetical protein n=1 Tax=Brevibacterium casei TaxID=33889 RepID=UPI0036F5D283